MYQKNRERHGYFGIYSKLAINCGDEHQLILITLENNKNIRTIHLCEKLIRIAYLILQSCLSIHLIEKTMVIDIINNFVSCRNQMLFLILMGLQDETFIAATHRTGEVAGFSINLITCVISRKIVNIKGIR